MSKLAGVMRESPGFSGKAKQNKAKQKQNKKHNNNNNNDNNNNMGGSSDDMRD